MTSAPICVTPPLSAGSLKPLANASQLADASHRLIGPMGPRVALGRRTSTWKLGALLFAYRLRWRARVRVRAKVRSRSRVKVRARVRARVRVRVRA